MQRNPIPLTFVISGLENRKMKLLTRWPPFLTGLVASFLHLSQIRSRALISDLFQSLLLILWLKWSGPLPVSGGCPQGSILGVWLFNVTTYDQEDDFVTNDQARLGLQPRHYREPPSPEHVNHREEAQPTTSSPSGEQVTALDLSPISNRCFRLTDRHIEFCPNVVNAPTTPAVLVTPPREEKVRTQVLLEKPVKIQKYVDDNLSIEKVNFGNVAPSLSNGVWVKTKQAVPSKNTFRSVTTNAKKKGMVVNADKTNMICVSDALSYTPASFIIDSESNRIDCRESMKVLGFPFSNKPKVSLHVSGVVKRLRQRYWMLTHLGKIGFDEEELVKVYRSSILPVADYCAPAYHPMTTDIHDQQLENAQIGALREERRCLL